MLMSWLVGTMVGESGVKECCWRVGDVYIVLPNGMVDVLLPNPGLTIGVAEVKLLRLDYLIGDH